MAPVFHSEDGGHPEDGEHAGGQSRIKLTLPEAPKDAVRAPALPASDDPRPPAKAVADPAFLAAVAFSGGIMASDLIWHPPLMWIAAVVLLASAAVWMAARRPAISLLAVAAAFFSLGAWVTQCSDAARAPEPRLTQFTSGDPVVLTGYVSRDGTLKPGTFGGVAQTIDFVVERIGDEAPSASEAGAVRLTLYSRGSRQAEQPDDLDALLAEPAAIGESDGSATPGIRRPLLYGERLRLEARLRPALNYRNPGAWDYRGYLHSIGIDALGSANIATAERLGGEGGTLPGRWRWAARRSLLRMIHRVWRAPEAGLFDGILIGERHYISREVQLEFQRSGTYHLLVVSGMNIAILAFAIFWLLRRLRVRPEIATPLTIAISCGYASLTDSGAPVLRAVLMFSVYQVTRLLYRQRAALNAVGVAALLLLVWSPRQLFDPSFQMTFLAVVVIGGLALPIIERTVGPYRRALGELDSAGKDQSLEPRLAQFRIELRMIARRLQTLLDPSGKARWARRVALAFMGGTLAFAIAVFEVVLVSLLMQLSLALPMAWYFHRVTLTALPANCLIVPLTGVLMPAAVAAVAIGYVSIWLAQPAAWIASWALKFILGTVSLLGSGRVADHRVPTPDLVVALACAAAFALAMVLVRMRRELAWAGLALLAVSAVWVGVRPAERHLHAGRLELTAIDVGQGDALLLVTPEGKTLLVDAGGLLGNGHSEFEIGEDVVSPYLWWRGLDRLDAVALSHAHADHMGGMAAVIRNFRPAELWLAPQVPTEGFRRLLRTANESRVNVRQLHAGETLALGSVQLEVLSPPADWELKQRVRDDDGLVLLAKSASDAAGISRRLLLSGDVGRRIESSLTGAVLEADVLKIGHHGSNTSSTSEFLAAVRPRFGVISAGVRNRFRHPRPEALRRLNDAGVGVLRTDLMGATTFLLDGSAVSASASNGAVISR